MCGAPEDEAMDTSEGGREARIGEAKLGEPLAGTSALPCPRAKGECENRSTVRVLRGSVDTAWI